MDKQFQMMADYIFHGIDPSFEIVTRAVNELRQQGRLKISYQKRSWIDRVKSANRDNNLLFKSLYGLSRRVGLCARICMAHSLGMNARLWSIKNVYEDNLDDDGNFHYEELVNEYIPNDLNDHQSKFCSEYDRFYPHYIIEDRLNQVHRRNEYFPSMMYIFLDNFSYLVQVNTTIRIEDQGESHEDLYVDDGRYRCNIQVVSVVAKITRRSEGRNEGKFMNLLKTLCHAHEVNRYDSVDATPRDDEESSISKDESYNGNSDDDGGDNGDENSDDNSDADDLRRNDELAKLILSP